MGEVRAAILPLDDKRLCSPGIGLTGGTVPGLENPLSRHLFAILSGWPSRMYKP